MSYSFLSSTIFAGLSHVHFLIVQHFWIFSAKRAIKPIQPQFIPLVRVSAVKCFYNTVPYLVTAKSCKVWMCWFVCMASKAVHLELYSYLSTETFLMNLQRFIIHRGGCNNVYCNNGTKVATMKKNIKFGRNLGSRCKIRKKSFGLGH